MKLLTSILAIFLFTSLSFSPEREEKFMDARKAKFKEFISHFPKASLPFSMSKEKLENFAKNYKKVLTKDKLIDTKYQEFFPFRLQGAAYFSRSYNYANTYYVAKLKETPFSATIVYAVHTAYGASEINDYFDIIFYLATYNNMGKELDIVDIASIGISTGKEVYRKFAYIAMGDEEGVHFKEEKGTKVWRACYIDKKGIHSSLLTDDTLASKMPFRLIEGRDFGEKKNSIPWHIKLVNFLNL